MDILQNLLFAKSDKSLQSIKKYIHQRSSTFIFTLLHIVNNQSEKKCKR